MSATKDDPDSKQNISAIPSIFTKIPSWKRKIVPVQVVQDASGHTQLVNEEKNIKSVIPAVHVTMPPQAPSLPLTPLPTPKLDPDYKLPATVKTHTRPVSRTSSSRTSSRHSSPHNSHRVRHHATQPRDSSPSDIESLESYSSQESPQEVKHLVSQKSYRRHTDHSRSPIPAHTNKHTSSRHHSQRPSQSAPVPYFDKMNYEIDDTTNLLFPSDILFTDLKWNPNGLLHSKHTSQGMKYDDYFTEFSKSLEG